MDHKTRSTNFRRRQKDEKPDLYKDYLLKQQSRSKLYRDKLKKELKKKKPNDVILEKKKKQLLQQRARQQKYLQRKKENILDDPETITPVKLMKMNLPATRNSIQSKRDYNRLMKQKQREKMSHQKKMWEKKKDRERKAKKRSHSICENEVKDHHCSSFNTKKTEWNVTSKIRASLPKSPRKFATVVTNLMNRASPRKRKALATMTGSSSINIPVKHLKRSKNGKKALKEIARALVNKSKRFIAKSLQIHRKTVTMAKLKSTVKRKANITQEAVIKDFYKRADISRVLPQKRYATKDGPGYCMQVSVVEAHRKYKTENATRVSLGKFAAIRPRNVRKLNASHREYCCCIYCINVRYKLLALSRATSDKDKKKTSEVDICQILLCSKADFEKFFDPKCINGLCKDCEDYLKTLETYYKDIPETKALNWTRWEKEKDILPNMKPRRIPVTKKGCKKELLTELVTSDIKHPAQGVSYFQHIHTAQWQQMQFDKIKRELPEGSTLQVLDFAKNREIKYQDEIKSAFFTAGQITLHPIVTYYRKEEGVVRESNIVISEDNTHDFHAVHHFNTVVDEHIAKQIGHEPTRKFIFSDGCSCQYKSKGPFADLSHANTVNRNFFGSEHGKGDCDADTGVINRAIDRAIIGNKVIINSATDLYNYCQSQLSLNDILSKRNFFLVKIGEVNRKRPETNVKTLTQSRKLHQAISPGDGSLKVRNLSCFCRSCLLDDSTHCVNEKHVNAFVTRHLQHVNTTTTLPDHSVPVLTESIPSPPITVEEVIENEDIEDMDVLDSDLMASLLHYLEEAPGTSTATTSSDVPVLDDDAAFFKEAAETSPIGAGIGTTSSHELPPDIVAVIGDDAAFFKEAAETSPIGAGIGTTSSHELPPDIVAVIGDDAAFFKEAAETSPIGAGIGTTSSHELPPDIVAVIGDDAAFLKEAPGMSPCDVASDSIITPMATTIEDDTTSFAVGTHVLIKHGVHMLPAVVTSIDQEVFWIQYYASCKTGMWSLQEKSFTAVESDFIRVLEPPNLLWQGGSRFYYNFNM